MSPVTDAKLIPRIMYPIWATLEYASMRFTFVWKIATSDMLKIETNASARSTMFSRMTLNEKTAPKTVKKKRSSMYTATFVAVAAMKAVTADGAYV